MQKYKVGIFWYINNCLFPIVQYSEKSELSDLTEKVDSDLSHIVCWDIFFGDVSPDIDYSTFPRGRVLYDLREKRYIFYADVCIPNSVISEYAIKTETLPFVIERDDHYKCDNCLEL